MAVAVAAAWVLVVGRTDVAGALLGAAAARAALLRVVGALRAVPALRGPLVVVGAAALAAEALVFRPWLRPSGRCRRAPAYLPSL